MQSNANAATQALLTQLWQKNLSQLRERLHLLDEVSTAAHPTEDRLKEAAGIAHKLAGSLGMFGYPAGTEAARQIESLLESSETLDSVRLRDLIAQLHAALPAL